MGERDRVLGPHPASLVAVRQESDDRGDGKVTLESYTTRSGEPAVSRTIVAEDLISDAGTLQPNVPHPADIDDDLKTAMDEATVGVLPERQRLPEDDEGTEAADEENRHEDAADHDDGDLDLNAAGFSNQHADLSALMDTPSTDAATHKAGANQIDRHRGSVKPPPALVQKKPKTS